eukprot:gene8150-12611_t
MNPSGLLALFFQLSFLSNHFINIRLSDTRNTLWYLLDERHSTNLKHLASKQLTIMNTKEEKFEKKLKSLTFQVKLFKFLLSNVVSSILVFITFLFFILLQVLLQTFAHFQYPNCTINDSQFVLIVPRSIPPLICISSIFYCFLLFIIDLFIFIKEEKKFSLKSYFFYDDYYRVRIELHFTFIITIFAFFTSLFPIISMFFDSKQQNYSFRDIGGALSFVMGEIIILSFTCFCGIFITIIRIFQRIKEPKMDSSEFEEFLKNEKFFDLFLDFSRKELSIENLYCFKDIQNYKKIENDSKLKKKANEILINYIEENSPLEVNISRKIRKATIQKVKNFESEIDKKHIFDSINFEIISNLQDTFGRFKFTDQYQNWNNRKNSKILIPYKFNFDRKNSSCDTTCSPSPPVTTPVLTEGMSDIKDIKLKIMEYKEDISTKT